MKKKIAALGTLICLMTLAVTGCSDLKGKMKGKNYDEFITVDVFSSESNSPGIQTGWFGKIVRDKFNMELNIIASNTVEDGDALFQTRVASGNIGDLIICNTENGVLSQLIEAGLVIDMQEMLEADGYVMQYAEAVESMQNLAETDGIYAIPTEVSHNSPLIPSVGTEPNYAPYIRWDIYEKIGCPEINNLDELLQVLKQMQDIYPATETGEKVYAISLFGDWDRNMMTFARNIACMYGYDEAGITLLSSDDGSVESPLDQTSVYQKGIEFLYKANQMGLIDPDSRTQSYDTVFHKMQNGQVLFSFWSWMGQQAYNTPQNTEEGRGFKMVPVKDMKISINGCRPQGNQTIGVMIGSQADDPQRLADFIEWLYSPEGIMASQASGPSETCGPEGLTWEMGESGPELTEFGKSALGGESVEVPDEWGGGSWQEGICAFNVTFVQSVDTNPQTGEAYMYKLWNSGQKERTKLDDDWTEVTGVLNAMEYLEKHNMLIVAPGDSYVNAKEDYQITTIRNQCRVSLIGYSWDLIYAEDEMQFSGIFVEMEETLENLKFAQIFHYDEQCAREKNQERQEIVEEYKEK